MDALQPTSPDVPADAYAAFQTLYAQEAENVCRAIYGMVLDGGVASGLMQETFACAFEDWNACSPPDPHVELLAIATRLAIAHEEEERHGRLGHVGPDSGSDASQDRNDIVCWLMRPLTADQRALIVLHLYQRVPAADVAELLGLAVGNVAPRARMAMQVLHQRALVWQSAVPSFRRGMASTGYYDPNADLNTQIIDALTDGLDAVLVSLPTLDEALDCTRRESANHRERRLPRVFIAAGVLVVMGAIVLAATRIAHLGNGPTQQAQFSPPNSVQSAAPSAAPSAPDTPPVIGASPMPHAGAPSAPPAASTRVTPTAAAPAPAAPAQPNSSTPPPAPASQRPASVPTTTTPSRSTSTPQSSQSRSSLPTCGLLGVGCP